MFAKVVTVAFEGVEARRVDVEVTATHGQQGSFQVVGLGDKAVAESRERVRGALAGIGLAFPAKRVVANLAPADLPKEGSHFDLPIALALLASMGVLPADALDGWVAVGELGLDGQIAPVSGALPAAMAAASMGLGLICPEANGGEAAWAGDLEILAPRSLIAVVNHFRGTQVMRRPEPGPALTGGAVPDLRDVKGQEQAKRALEVAAAGGHNLLLTGPPGSGKSMLAQRLPGLLPPLTPAELLETSMIWSLAGMIAKGALTSARPFRSPHHSASMAALTGGGLRAKPGEVSLAHNGVLFLDELPEFSPQALDSLRTPLETGEVTVARANAHVRYPARFQLVAAQNPCGRVAILLIGNRAGFSASRRETKVWLGASLGAHLKARRHALGHRRVDAAAAVAVDPKTWMWWERGEHQPVVHHYPGLISYLGYEPWEQPRTLADRLLVERRRRGLSIARAAELAGIDEGTWRRWERGELRVSRRSVPRLSTFLCCSVSLYRQGIH